MESEIKNYVYGDKKIPDYQYISDYKSLFYKLSNNLDDNFDTSFRGYEIPAFINIEMTVQNDQHIMSCLFFPNFMNEFAEYIKNRHNY